MPHKTSSQPTPMSPAMTMVIYAKDKARVSAFYRETLGLHATEAQPSHDLLQGPGVELVIHAIPEAYAADITITQPPQAREDTPFKPAFAVASLDAVRMAATACGGFLNPPDRAWQLHGATVLDGWDPEGNVVQFKQANAAPGS